MGDGERRSGLKLLTEGVQVSPNDQGAVLVGEAYFDRTQQSVAFASSGGVLRDLNTLIDPASGWQLDSATAINNARQSFQASAAPRAAARCPC